MTTQNQNQATYWDQFKSAPASNPKSTNNKLIKSFGQTLISLGLVSSVVYAVALAIEIYGLGAFVGPQLTHAFACLFLMPFSIFGLIYNIYFIIRGRNISKRGVGDQHVHRTSTVAIVTQSLQLALGALIILIIFTGDFIALFQILFIEVLYLILLCIGYICFISYVTHFRSNLR